MRTQLKLSLAFFAVGVVLGLLLLWFFHSMVSPDRLQRWIEARNPGELIPVLLLIPLTTLIHESGHLLAGLLGGMAFRAIYVKPILISNEGRLRVKLDWRSPVGGYVTLAPRHEASSKLASAAYIAGGPLANFLVGIGLLPWVQEPHTTTHLLITCLSGFSLLCGVASIAPIPFQKGFVSDGVRLFEVLKSTSKRH